MSTLAKDLQAFRTEEIFGLSVKHMAQVLGYRVYHTHDSRRSSGGFPDWCMVRRRSLSRGWTPRLVFAELKLKPESAAAGRPRADQQAWLDDLEDIATGIRSLAGGEFWPALEVHVWRPPDWFDGTIERILRG